MYFQQKYFKIIFISILAIVSWTYFAVGWREGKAEIIPQIADIAEKAALPYRLLRLSFEERDGSLIVPIQGLPLSQIDNSWGYPRDEGRTHEGIDLFADRGTPVFSVTRGYVVRAGVSERGGNIVFVVGKGGVRYYYAHLDKIASGLKVGQEVTSDTVVGFVGNTGNAITTPPHLHFGMYTNRAENPYQMFVSR